MRNKAVNWLRNRLQVIFRNKRDFSDISLYEFSNLSFLIYISITLILIFSISFFLSTTILSKWFDPRYVERKANEELIMLSNSIDSLIYESQIKDQYIENIMIILSGRKNDEIEVSSNRSDVKINDLTNDYSAIDSFFRKEFENNSTYFDLINSSNINQDILLISPVSSGIISSPYNPTNNHFGVDYVCNDEEPIKAVFGGTILTSSWTKDSGYVISII